MKHRINLLFAIFAAMLAGLVLWALSQPPIPAPQRSMRTASRPGLLPRSEDANSIAAHVHTADLDSHQSAWRPGKATARKLVRLPRNDAAQASTILNLARLPETAEPLPSKTGVEADESQDSRPDAELDGPETIADSLVLLPPVNQMDEPGSEPARPNLDAAFDATAFDATAPQFVQPQPSVKEPIPAIEPAPIEHPSSPQVTAQPPLREQGLRLVPSSLHDPQMRAVAERATLRVQRGFALAERGAYFSARAEFIQALRLISQALDVATGEATQSTALAAGMRALEESDDFVPHGSRLEADVELATLISAHRTPVLKDEDVEALTALVARREYYTYAAEQLAIAAGRERAGSMALYGLARVYSTLGTMRPSEQVSAAKAIALNQAAIAVDADNYMAANELGVLLVQFGQHAAAREMFERSVETVPQSTVWHNLAVVNERLGDMHLATEAHRRASAIRAQEQSPGGGRATQLGIEWQEPNNFARNSHNAIPAAGRPAATQR